MEFAGLHGMSAAQVSTLVGDLGLQVSSSHVPFPSADNIQQIANQEHALGNKLIVSGLGPNDFKTLDRFNATADRFREACQVAREHGLRFALHNHWWEFHDLEGRTGYDRLMEAVPELRSELDVYWAAYGKSDPVAVVRQYRARIPVLHIKDGTLEENKPHTAVGSGTLDIPAIINAAEPDKLDWLIVELDECATDMMEAVRQSYDYLVGTGLAEGSR